MASLQDGSVYYIISQGLGSPANIPHFLTLGLSQIAYTGFTVRPHIADYEDQGRSASYEDASETARYEDPRRQARHDRSVG